MGGKRNRSQNCLLAPTYVDLEQFIVALCSSSNAHHPVLAVQAACLFDKAKLTLNHRWILAALNLLTFRP